MNLLVYAKPVIQYANAIVLTIKEIAKALAQTKQQMDGIDYEKEFASFGNSVEDTTEAVEELSNSLSLLGLDKINVLGSSGSSIADGLSVEGNILNALKEYKMNLDKVSYRAKEISEKMMTWLGYSKVLNKETGENEYHLSEGNNNLNKILIAVKGIIGIVVSSALVSNIMKIVSMFSEMQTSLKGTSAIFTKLGAKGGIIGIIIALLFYAYETSEKIKGAFDDIFGVLAELIKPIMEIITDIIKAIMPILDSIVQLLEVTLVPILKIIKPILEVIVEVIKYIEILVEGFVNYISSIIVAFTDTWTGVWATVIEYISAVWATIVALFTGNSDKIGEIWYSLGEKLKDIWGNVWDSIKNVFLNIINGLNKGLVGFVNMFADIINDLTSSLSGTWKWLGIPAIPEIPKLKAREIAFAKGGVITQPTNALMGEYPNAKSNPEIVAPQSIMKETFLEAVTPLINAILQGDNNLLKALNDKETNVYLNGRKISEAIYDDLGAVATRKGKVIFASNV